MSQTTTKPSEVRATGPTFSVVEPVVSVRTGFNPTVLADRPYTKAGPAERFRRNVRLFEIMADLITVVLAVTLSYGFYYQLGLGKHIHYSLRLVVGVAFGFAVLFVLMLDREGAYNHGGSLLRVKDTERILQVTFESFLLAFAATFFTGKLFSRWILITTLTVIPVSLLLQKLGFYMVVRMLHSKGYGRERVLVCGSGILGRRVVALFKRSPKLGLDPVALVDDDPSSIGTAVYEMSYERRNGSRVIQGPVTQALISQYHADLLVIADPTMSNTEFGHLVQEARASGARVSFVPAHFSSINGWIDYEEVDGILLASFSQNGRHWVRDFAKTATDLVGATVITILGSPVLVLLAALVWLDSRGPIIFSQIRIGRNGEPFRLYKFRTMRTDSPTYEYSPTTSDDPRITRMGRFLRRTSLDELPQLINVLRGDMSLVGPRPEMPFIVEHYNEIHRMRHQVKPGITGLWQLSGDRAYRIHENIEYDLYYIRNQGFFLDLAILLHTMFFAMRGI
jgi:exopolysaccharide biosynthesis polyprenyl glycosylphosphotransferase